jgi:serine protease Do
MATSLLNTFILSEGSGSEGLGFAIPARVVTFVYGNLWKYGHVHRTEIQAGAQTITPTLAAGLGLAQNWGVVISDVTPRGPADAAGLKLRDIVVAVDGRPILGLLGLTAALYLHAPDEAVRMEILRGNEKIPREVPALQYQG